MESHVDQKNIYTWFVTSWCLERWDLWRPPPETYPAEKVPGAVAKCPPLWDTKVCVSVSKGISTKVIKPAWRSKLWMAFIMANQSNLLLTNPSSESRPLWSGLINHWFPLIRPAIKPLYMQENHGQFFGWLFLPRSPHLWLPNIDVWFDNSTSVHMCLWSSMVQQATAVGRFPPKPMKVGSLCLVYPRIHPGRLTWTIIMEVWKIMFLSKWVICRFHVNLPGCIWLLDHVIYTFQFMQNIFHQQSLTKCQLQVCMHGLYQMQKTACCHQQAC